MKTPPKLEGQKLTLVFFFFSLHDHDYDYWISMMAYNSSLIFGHDHDHDHYSLILTWKGIKVYIFIKFQLKNAKPKWSPPLCMVVFMGIQIPSFYIFN